MQFLVVVLAIVSVSSAQYVLHQQSIAYAMHQPQMHTESPLANPAVVDNSIVESHLPAEYMRASNFYRNPKTADALAKDSWLTDKEMPVFEREADKIPREQVFKIFKNAGFLHRR